MKIADAFVELRSDSARFASEARSQISAVLDTIAATVGVAADTSGFREDVSRAVKEAVVGQSADVPITPDGTGLREKVKRETTGKGEGSEIEVPVKPTTKTLVADLAKIETEIKGLRNLEVDLPVGIDKSKLEAQLTELEVKAKALAKLARVEISAQINEGELDRQLAVLPAKAEAAAKAAHIHIEPDVDTNPLTKLIAGLGSSKDEAHGLDAALSALKFGGLIAGAGDAAAALVSVGGGAIALVAALGPLTGLLGTLPALATGAGLGFGVFKLGLSGISDAVKALDKAQTDSAADAQKSAEAQVAAAQRVRDATDALNDARQRQADLAVDGPRRAESAARSLAQTERDLARAEADELQALKDLNQARQDEQRRLEDLAASVSQNAISEEAAIIRKAQAQQNLAKVNADPRSSEIDKRRAANELAQAEQSLADIQRRKIRDSQDLNAAQKKGVEGSDAVKAAQDRVTQSQQAVTRATVAERDARIEVGRVNRDVAREQIRAARDVEKAQAGVTKAIEDNTEAVKSQGASADAAAKALAGLSPAGRSFAEFLGSLRPLLKSITADVQESFLPGVQKGLQSLLGLAPIIRDALKGAGAAFGDFIAKFGALLSSGPFKADFQAILAGSTRLMSSLGDATLNVIDGFRHIAIAAQPLVDGLGALAVQISAVFKGWAEQGRNSGELQKFFEGTLQTLKLVVGILGHFFELIVKVGAAARPLGELLLRVFDGVLVKFNNILSTAAGENSLRQFFDSLGPPLLEAGRLIGDVLAAIISLGSENLGNLTDALHILRVDILPGLVEMAHTLAPLLAAIIQSGALQAAFKAFRDIILPIIEALTWLVQHVPGFGPLLGTLLGSFLAFKLVSSVFSPLILGLQGLVGGAATAIHFFQDLKAAISAASTAEGLGKLSAFFGSFGKDARAARAAKGAVTGAATEGLASVAGGAAAGAGAEAGGAGLAGIAGPAAIAAAAIGELIFKGINLKTVLDDSKGASERFAAGLHLIPLVGEGIAILDVLTDKIFGIKNVSGKAVEGIGDLAGKVPSLLGGVGEAIGRFFTDTLPTFFTEQLPKALESAVGFVGDFVSTTLPEAIGQALGAAVGAFIGFPLLVARTIIEGIPLLISTGLDIGRAVLNGVVTGISAIPGLVAQVGGWILDRLAALPGQIFGVLQQIPSVVGGVLSQIPGIVIGFIGQIPGLLGSIFSNGVQIVSNVLSQLPSVVAGAFKGIFNFLTSGPVGDFLGSFFGSLADGFSKGWDQINKVSGNAANDVVRTVAELATRIGRIFSGAGRWLYNVGKAIVEGLINGIKSVWHRVEDTLGDLASHLPSWIKKPLGIKSPSEVFAKIGEAVTEGLAVGIENNAGLVDDRMKKLVSSIAALGGKMQTTHPTMNGPNFGGGAGPGADKQMALIAAALGKIAGDKLQPTPETPHDWMPFGRGGGHSEPPVTWNNTFNMAPGGPRETVMAIPARLRAHHYLTGGRWSN